jgi:hypothetical protein
LLTELRYTLGQLHVQLGDLSSSSVRASAANTDRTVEQEVASMVQDEAKYQAQYAQLLNIAAPQSGGETGAAGEEVFIRQRERTLAMLQQAGEPWPEELIAAVQQQVANDRRHTTVIADLRKGLFEQDQRPDLDEPLTRPESR